MQEKKVAGRIMQQGLAKARAGLGADAAAKRAARRLVHKHGLIFHGGQRNGAGRKRLLERRTFKQYIYEASVPMAKWSLSWQCSWRSWPGSRRAAWQAIKDKYTDFSFLTRFIDLTTRHQVPIIVSKKRVGVCPVCEHYRTKLLPQLRHRIEEITAEMYRMCEKSVDDIPVMRDQREQLERPDWCHTYANKLACHAEACEGCAAKTVALTSVSVLETEVVPRVEELAFHNSLRTAIRDDWRRCDAIEGGDTLHMTCDFKAPGRKLTRPGCA